MPRRAPRPSLGGQSPHSGVSADSPRVSSASTTAKPCNPPIACEIDPAKDASNIRKHGVSLALASEIDWSDVIARPDNRRDYFELREIGYAVIQDCL
jgi:hypothetical protein